MINSLILVGQYDPAQKKKKKELKNLLTKQTVSVQFLYKSSLPVKIQSIFFMFYNRHASVILTIIICVCHDFFFPVDPFCSYTWHLLQVCPSWHEAFIGSFSFYEFEGQRTEDVLCCRPTYSKPPEGQLWFVIRWLLFYSTMCFWFWSCFTLSSLSSTDFTKCFI